MKRFIALSLFVITALSLTSCRPTRQHQQRLGGPWDKVCQDRVDNEEMTKIVLTYARDLKKQYKLKLHDSRMYYNDSIYKLRLDFTSQQISDLCEARFVLVDIVEGYLKRINENSILRGQIANRPFSANNIEVHVTFTSFYVKLDDPMYVQSMILEDGTAFFFNAELGQRTSEYWHKRIEPYSKTLQIVNIEREIGPEEDVNMFDEEIGKYFESGVDE
ncbi:hypothetical protein [Estrella lausannensis]|uniref:Conserved putative secreted protein n=1 Tax=Estrella lausannensis TaxID=483423 RepID=A0A0H5E660_9BACT|nr:hypothetical protein [Estrella lausannensis]CRX38750.1 Conserved putative secreted protein [Estrella lausannensis]